MSNVKTAPLFLHPRIVRSLVSPIPSPRVTHVPILPVKLVDEVKPKKGEKA